MTRDWPQFILDLSHGEVAAWKELVTQCSPGVRYIASRMQFTPSDTEDLLQATLLRVHTKLDDLEDPARLLSWTYTVALNEARQMLRKRRDSASPDAPLAELASSFPSPDEIHEANERARQVDNALSQVDDRCRALIKRLYFETPKPSYSHISAELGIAIGSIGPIRARCLERLGKLLLSVSKNPLAASIEGTRHHRPADPGESSKDKS